MGQEDRGIEKQCGGAVGVPRGEVRGGRAAA